MEALIAPRGLVVDLITPFKSDGAIDGRGLGRLLDRVITSAQAILLSGPGAGEGKNMSLAQRLELMEKSLVVIRGRIPVMIWITRDSEEKTWETLLALKKVLERRKYNGQVFWVDTPLYYHSNRGLPAHYGKLSQEVNEPFILHNDPEFIKGLARPFKRSNIRTGILKELIQLKAMAGLIFLGKLDRAYNYQGASRDHARFRIYDGDESQFLTYPSMSGAVSLGANLVPIAWRRIIQSSLQLTAHQEKSPDLLRQTWELGVYLRDLTNIYHPMPVAIVKEVLSDMGVIETPTCTFPTGNLEEPRRQARELIELLDKP